MKEKDIANKRYCNQHDNGTVFKKRKINVKGIDEIIDFKFENLPTGFGVANQTNTFAVRDRLSIEKWNEDQEKEKNDHGEISGARINHFKKAFFSLLSPKKLERKHGINPIVAQHIGFNNHHQFSPSLISPPIKNLMNDHRVKSSITHYKAITSHKI